jgi:micrococcal nuclease
LQGIVIALRSFGVIGKLMVGLGGLVGLLSLCVLIAAALVLAIPQGTVVEPSPGSVWLSPTPTIEASEFPPYAEVARVTRVFDGNTIEVELGTLIIVRYIGINAPQIGDPCGSEALMANAALVDGQTVTMVKDEGGEARSEVDRFGRLLRYVYVGDTLVNAQLIVEGYAQAMEYPPGTNSDLMAYFTGLELEARTTGDGCWAGDDFAGPGAPGSLSTSDNRLNGQHID